MRTVTITTTTNKLTVCERTEKVTVLNKLESLDYRTHLKLSQNLTLMKLLDPIKLTSSSGIRRVGMLVTFVIW